MHSFLLAHGHSAKVLKRPLREMRLTRTKTSVGKRTVRDDGYLTLPYIDESLLCKVKSVVKRSGLDVRLAWRNENKLKSHIVHSAFKMPRSPGGNRLIYAKVALWENLHTLYTKECGIIAGM